MSAVVADDKAIGTGAAPDVSGVNPIQSDKAQPATSAPSAAPEPKVPSFFSKKENKAAEKPSDDLNFGVDVSKLRPELQPFYKEMQAGLTKKFQSMADERKAWESDFQSQKAALAAERDAMSRNHDALMAALTRGTQPEAQAAPNPMEQVQALRAEGNYEAADALLVKIATDQAKAAIEPIERKAQTDSAIASFQKLAMDTVVKNPLVREYNEAVSAAWDSPDPGMRAIRQDILSDPSRMERYVPLYFEYLAVKEHARRLEEVGEQRIEAEVKRRMDTARSQARKVPPSLVNSAGESRATGRSGPGTLNDAFQRALNRVTGEA